MKRIAARRQCIHVTVGQLPRWAVLTLADRSTGRSVMTLCPLCTGFTFGVMLRFERTGTTSERRDTMADVNVDLDKLQSELETEKCAIALELARGEYGNRDRYTRIEERLAYLAEARKSRPATPPPPPPPPEPSAQVAAAKGPEHVSVKHKDK